MRLPNGKKIEERAGVEEERKQKLKYNRSKKIQKSKKK